MYKWLLPHYNGDSNQCVGDQMIGKEWAGSPAGALGYVDETEAAAGAERIAADVAAVRKQFGKCGVRLFLAHKRACTAE